MEYWAEKSFHHLAVFPRRSSPTCRVYFSQVRGKGPPEEHIHPVVIPVMLPCGVNALEARLSTALLYPLTMLARGNALLA